MNCRLLAFALVSAALLGGCASSSVDDRTADRSARSPAIGVGIASSDRRLLAASASATEKHTEVASTDTAAASGATPVRRPRNDREEVGAAMGSSSWKVNRDPKRGQGELCAIQNYYLAPKPVR